MIKAIAAVSLNGVFGDSRLNTLPWANSYPEDMKFFRTKTANSTIIFGRKTFESFGSKPLPKRRNILISSTPSTIYDVETFSSVKDAIKTTSGDVWLIGGLGIYAESLKLADEICVTSIPEVIEGNDLVYFPYINPQEFYISENIILNHGNNLTVSVYKRVGK
jgi:dihydrofolate reductase